MLDGADATAIRPARRLLVFASLVTLALNVSGPLITQHYGRAAFDAFGPLLLIGWAEVGPGLLDVLNRSTSKEGPTPLRHHMELAAEQASARDDASLSLDDACAQEDLLARACAADVRHWQVHRRPISARGSDARSGDS